MVFVGCFGRRAPAGHVCLFLHSRIGRRYGTQTPDFGFERDLYSDFEDVTQPWRFNLGHHYEIRKFTGTSQKRSWIKADYGFNPTPYWRIDYSINYANF